VFIVASCWIAYAQIRENPSESLVVAGVLALGGVLNALFGRNAPRPAIDAPVGPLTEAHVVPGDPI